MRLSEAGRRRFEVAIIGSGPAGVSAARPLLQAGVDVLLVDGARQAPLPPPIHGTIGTFRSDPERWRHQFGGDLGGLLPHGDISPKFATPLARAVTAGYQDALKLETESFWAAGGLREGGLSHLWGAVAEVYDDADLAEYPFGAAELAASYRAVMARIGVSDDPAPAEAISRFRSPVQEILRRHGAGSRQDGVVLQPARNAVLRRPLDGRDACSACGLCLWGCARGSIYNSAAELPELRRFPTLSYAEHARVLRLYEADGCHGLDIEQQGARVMVRASRVVLAAGTIGSTALVLQRLGQYDTPVRLLTNPVGAIAFVVPRLFGQALPELSFSLGQLSYKVAIAGARDHAAGILYGADTLPLGVIADRLPLSRPMSLRFARALMPALVLATCYLPGRFSRNTLSISRGDGVPLIVIRGAQTVEATQALQTAARRLARHLRRLGALALPGSFTVSQPGADAHYAGTLPMGASGAAACSAWGELNSCPGLFVVDGAALPALPARHCTLTIMANADRIGRRLAERSLHGSAIAGTASSSS